MSKDECRVPMYIPKLEGDRGVPKSILYTLSSDFITLRSSSGLGILRSPSDFGTPRSPSDLGIYIRLLT
jgi:hypothetical protein